MFSPSLSKTIIVLRTISDIEILYRSRNLKYHNKKRQDDYGQNYYKIYHLAVVFNIASNKYWKDLLAFVRFFLINCFAPNSLALLFFKQKFFI